MKYALINSFWLPVALWLLGGVAVFGAEAQVVLDWNSLIIDAIRVDNTGPTLSSRNLAILHCSIYDSVNSILRTHQPWMFSLDTPPGTSEEAAAVGAAYKVMGVLYPSFAARENELYEDWLTTTTASAARTNGLALGTEVAQLVLQERAQDGSATDIPYIPSDTPGQWQRTPPFFRPPVTPQWRYVTPFCLPEIESFLPASPPPLNSVEYAAAFNEVKALGSKTSAERTAEQTQIATFWSDFSYTSMPPGHWHLIAETIVRGRGDTLAEAARLFALISVAQADAAIVCWEAKFRYNLWRPVTAIQRADEDDNPLTAQDKTWDHFLAAPPFPAYTSGHSTFSKASAQVLTSFYGTDAIEFTATSDALPGVFRTFQSLSACADEIGMSRIYGGIHYQFDNVAGKASGKRVGDFISENFLLDNERLPSVFVEGAVNSVAQLRIHGHFGRTVVLHTSTDLSHWMPFSTNLAVMGGFKVEDTSFKTNAFRFYRAVEP